LHKQYITYILALILSVSSAALNAGEMDWTAADSITHDSGLSLMRYFGHGLGAYPYSLASPHAGMRVRIDGVPLRSVGPFGPDLDMIPAGLVDSLSVGAFNQINIATRRMTGETPETVTKFLLGTKHRFNFGTLFDHPLSERSGLVFSGASSGSRGASAIEKNSSRSYSLNYHRSLINDVRLLFSSRGWRDRDGLADLETASFMGERKSEGTSLMLGIDSVKIGDTGKFSSNVYWQSMNSRFHRFGTRKSIDDRSAGLNLDYSNVKGNTRYGLSATHDIFSITSRVHDNAWSRNETDLSGWLAVPLRFAGMDVSGGIIHSSHYGAGVKGSVEIITGADKPFQVVVTAKVADYFPDSGAEFYTSPAFGDSAHTADLEKSHERIFSLGLRDRKGDVKYGLSLFATKSETPVFQISSTRLTSVSVYSYWPTNSVMCENEFQGVQGDFQFTKEGAVDIDFSLHGVLRYGDDHESWPYPNTEFNSECVLSDKYFNGVLDADLFVNGRFAVWDEGVALPEGGHFFLTTGLSLTVGTLELFYRIENITNEDPHYFNTMGWFGRNSMWGVNWRFID